MCLGHYLTSLQVKGRCVSGALILNNNLWTSEDLQKPALWNVFFWTQKSVCLTASAHGVVLISVRQNKQWRGKLIQKAEKLRRNIRFHLLPFLLALCCCWNKNGSAMWTMHAAPAGLHRLCSEDVLWLGARHQGMLNSDKQLLLLKTEQL